MTVDLGLARQVEAFDQQAWEDMYRAIPPAFGAALGLASPIVEGIPLFLCGKIPFVHFNAAGAALALQSPTDAALDRVRAAWRDRGISQHWIHTFPEVTPDFSVRIAARGYTESSRWDRVHRGPAPVAMLDPLARAIDVRRVGPADGLAWAGFIDTVYGLPTSPWLLALVGRPGWHHYAAFEAGRMVAVRTLFTRDGWGWLGIDAPVPGAMTQDFEPDRAILRHIVGELDALGCAHLISDVETPAAERAGAAYAGYRELGFEVLYARVNVVGS